MPKSTCQGCKRTILLVDIGGELTATEPELINVVPASRVTGDAGGGVRMSTRVTPARQLHAALCEGYQEQAMKARLRAELRAYNQKHGPSGARRVKGF